MASEQRTLVGQVGNGQHGPDSCLDGGGHRYARVAVRGEKKKRSRQGREERRVAGAGICRWN